MLFRSRPILNLRLEKDVKAMRNIAEQAFAFVRGYKGSHSGEHGDGVVRSEFHEKMFGERLVRAFEEVKDRFDPKGLLNPGKVVRAPKFDDRSVMRFGPHYREADFEPALAPALWRKEGAHEVRGLAACELFQVDLLRLPANGETQLGGQRVHVLAVTEGELSIVWRDTVCELKPGEFCVVPASCAVGTSARSNRGATFLRALAR